MDEEFDTKTLILSALWEGTGQLASGRTTKGLILFVAGTVFSVLGGVKGTMLKLLTGGRRPIKALPDKLNPLALVWLGIYFYSLYDAYTIAAGTEQEEEVELTDYEEYVPEVLQAARGSSEPPRAEGNAADLDWEAGVNKEQLMAELGDDEQVRGVYGQYLPSERVFHSLAEAENLIPVQAWQDAQGHAWTGGEPPTTDGASGYLDSAAGQMPPGEPTG